MLWLMLLVVAAFSGAVYLFHSENIWRKYRVAAQLPGPKAYPLIGSAWLFINKTAIENFQILAQLIQEHGDIMCLWLGTEMNIFLSNTKDVEALLSSPHIIVKSSEYDFLRPWLRDGLLISKGKKWHQRRKILTPAFHFKILEQFVQIFDQQASTMMKTLAQFDRTDHVELYQISTLYTLDVICESAMGTSVNAQKNANSEYVRAVKEMSNIIHLRMFDLSLRINVIFELSSLAKKMRQALRILHGFTDAVIQERRAELLLLQHTNNGQKKEIDAKTATDASVGAKEKRAFLDILLEARVAGEPLSDLDIREEVDTFMFEGHDTTTSAMTFVYYCIAKNPEVQRKCFEEVHRVLGSEKAKPVTLNDLNKLHYLELVIKETMRLYPSVPLFGREIMEEVTINGRVYPAGCNLLVPCYSMGRDARLFDKPLEFRPERFDVDAQCSNEKIKPFSYIPFSAGPRNCIGQKFAMLELKSVISKTLRHFELTLADDSLDEPQLQAELILSPGSRIHFHINPRKH